nr:hypothetical protein CFP56_37396 [Quercus suber]
MASIEDLRSRFSLTEEEESGADVPRKKEVLELEPWTYDKSLVVFRHTVDVESAPLLTFDSVTFWVQLHNVLDQCLTQATGEAVGNTIGTLV